MVPLAILTTLSHLGGYYLTRGSHWLWSAGLTFLPLPWTALLMNESIEGLRSAKAQQIQASVRKFSFLHHFRTVVSVVAFGLSLYYNVH